MGRHSALSRRIRNIDLDSVGLVPVELRTLMWPQIGWRSSHVEVNNELYPLCMPMEGESAQLYSSIPPVVGFAEMYGGLGVGANAGGVRCANVLNYQIKGIGQTVLAGAVTDKWHKHGACSLQDAIKEAILSEIFHHAAPHGAVRSFAVVETGSAFATEAGVEKVASSARRALLYRQPSVRVAHFMRSSFICVDPHVQRRELGRMTKNIPLLTDALIGSEAGRTFDNLLDGLDWIYERLMQQVAVLRTKRLVHGSLIPSNFCLDGRLIDFTTAGAVSGHQSILVSYGSLPTDQQHVQILSSLADLLFYCSKFDARLKFNPHAVGGVAEQLASALVRKHDEFLEAARIELVGLTPREVKRLSRSSSKGLASALSSVIRASSSDSATYFGGSHEVMPSTAPGRDLRFAIIAAVVGAHLGAESVPVEILSGCAGLRRSLIDGLRNEYANAACELGSLATNRLLGRIIRIVKANYDLRELFRGNLDRTINDICIEQMPYSTYIDATVSFWRKILSSPEDGVVDLGNWFLSIDCKLDERCRPFRDNGSLDLDEYHNNYKCSLHKLLGVHLPEVIYEADR